MVVETLFEAENEVAAITVERHRDRISGALRTKLTLTLWKSNESYGFTLDEANSLRQLIDQTVDRAIATSAENNDHDIPSPREPGVTDDDLEDEDEDDEDLYEGEVFEAEEEDDQEDDDPDIDEDNQADDSDS